MEDGRVPVMPKLLKLRLCRFVNTVMSVGNVPVTVFVLSERLFRVVRDVMIVGNVPVMALWLISRNLRAADDIRSTKKHQQHTEAPRVSAVPNPAQYIALANAVIWLCLRQCRQVGEARR